MIETERLILRGFSPVDDQDLYDYLSLEEVVKYEPYPVQTMEECKIEARERSYNTDFWAVCLKESNKLIGNIYFHQTEPKSFMTCELGYVFNPNYYHKGYATEACLRMMGYGFKELGAHRIVARCNTKNTASWRLLERLGMRREGHFKKPAYFKTDSEGRPIWHDAYHYALLAEEYKSKGKGE
jgi:[ribosomal protein S5]-alanine N-acetyltransferase